MAERMTPSEIAEVMDRAMVDLAQNGWAKTSKDCQQAAATIRELEASNKARADIIYAQSKASDIDREKLKIATEALEKMVSLYENDHDPECLARPQWLVEALSRIKEVV